MWQKGALLAVILISGSLQAVADEEKETIIEAMDNQRIDTLLRRITDDVEGEAGYWRITVNDYQAVIITDESADRMRIIVPIAESSGLEPGRMLRLMQANFDSALDARYCIAKGTLWSAFIHPLAELSDDEFVEGVAQTINLAATYGSTYSSGALVFSGGDSKAEQKKYYNEIIERANSI